MNQKRVVLLEKHITHGIDGQYHSWEIQASRFEEASLNHFTKEVHLISVVRKPILSVISGSQQKEFIADSSEGGDLIE